MAFWNFIGGMFMFALIPFFVCAPLLLAMLGVDALMKFSQWVDKKVEAFIAFPDRARDRLASKVRSLLAFRHGRKDCP